MKIIANQLSKRFNREWIFRNFTYEFVTGKTYALVGPNGSGKSTLLQVLFGQMPPSKGTVLYSNEKNRILDAEVYQHISIATPYMELIDEFTLEEMVSFHFSFKSVREKATLAEVIEKMELQDARKKVISNFSSGMRQRLKLALAFFSQSEVFFLDEPTTNLDAKSIDWYWKNLTPILDKSIIIIASNQATEYPQTAENINILNYK